MPNTGAQIADIGARLTSPITKAGLAYWDGLRNGEDLPRREDVSPDEMVEFLPHVILLDVLRDPLDFRYRLAGTIVERHFLQPNTGRRMSRLPHQAPPSHIWSACERVVTSAEPYLDAPPYVGPNKGAVTPEAMMLPFIGPDGTVSTIMVVVDFLERKRGVVDLLDELF